MPFKKSERSAEIWGRIDISWKRKEMRMRAGVMAGLESEELKGL